MGKYPWLNTPTEAGWYWFRVNPSTAIRGPVEVIRITGRTTLLLTGKVLETGLWVSNGWDWKPVEQFQRSWCGPLPRPVDDHPTVLQPDAQEPTDG